MGGNILQRFAVGWLSLGFFFLAAVVIGGFSSAAGEQNLVREQFPSWVVEYPIPEFGNDQTQSATDGVYNLLQDTQILIGSGKEEMFQRTIQRITNRSGLETAAKLQLEFSPDTDDIILYRAAVWRDGKLLDQTNTVRSDIMRRESELESDVITNDKTADIRLQDVRVGDLVDYAWAWRTKKTYWSGHHFSTHEFGWSVPVKQVSVRLVKPADLVIHTKASRGLPDYVETRMGDKSVFTWTLKGSKPIPAEEDTPDWLEPWPELEISTMANWKAVVDWAIPLYGVSGQLPSDLTTKVDAIGAKTANPQIRITDALRLVQDNVRYTSIPLVSGGYAPRSPSDTWISGYGDCKDKSALLVAVLRRLNIEAVPALTDTLIGPKLPKLQPSANSFNHVIVRVYGLPKPLWLDPTGSHEGGTAPDIAGLGYGFALPLRTGQTAFEPIANPTPEKPTIDVHETHHLTNAGVRIDVVTSYSHDEADIMRAQIAKYSKAEFDLNGLEYFAGMYPNIRQFSETKINDRRSENKLTVSQQYFLPKAAEKYEETVTSYLINAWTFSDLYPKIKATKRVAPIEMPRLINRRHVVKLATPGRLELPSDEKIDGKAFVFTRTTKRTSEYGIIEFSLRGKADIVAPDSADAYREDTERLDKLSYEYVDLTDEFGGFAVLFLIAFLGFLVGGIALLFVRVKQIKAEEASETDGGTLCPVGLVKFSVLSISTMGIYSVFWFWRCWRQLWHVEALQIQPFWRAFFGGFWIFALFDAARERANYKMASWIGVTIMILYLLSGVIGYLAESDETPLLVHIAITVLSAIILLPIVKQVNAANSPVLVAQFSQFRPIHWIVVALSLPLTGSMMMIS
jgi:transglutaminase-like putative cysteine protease